MRNNCKLLKPSIRLLLVLGISFGICLSLLNATALDPEVQNILSTHRLPASILKKINSKLLLELFSQPYSEIHIEFKDPFTIKPRQMTFEELDRDREKRAKYYDKIKRNFLSKYSQEEIKVLGYHANEASLFICIRNREALIKLMRDNMIKRFISNEGPVTSLL